jgi:hypothetical protein
MTENGRSPTPFRSDEVVFKSTVEYIAQNINSGSPIPSICSKVDFNSNTLDNTTLNIFWTLMECDAEVNMTGAFIAFPYFRASLSISSCSSGGNVVNISYLVPTKNAKAVYKK